MGFPMEVQSGDLIVKIYQIENKRRDSFTVSYFADGKPGASQFIAMPHAPLISTRLQPGERWPAGLATALAVFLRLETAKAVAPSFAVRLMRFRN